MRYQTKDSAMKELAFILDQVWHSIRDKDETASDCLSKMSKAATLEVVAFDAAIILGLEKPEITIDRDLGQVSVKSRGKMISYFGSIENIDSLPTFVAYPDVNLSLVTHTDSAIVPDFQVTHDLKDVLIALQVVRDHSDSILMLPQPMREERLQKMASQTPYNLEQFKSLVVISPRLHG